jgi:hypothetical protein
MCIVDICRNINFCLTKTTKIFLGCTFLILCNDLGSKYSDGMESTADIKSNIYQKTFHSEDNCYPYEVIKVEDVKEELNEMKSVEDPLSLPLDNQTNHEEDNPYDYDKIDIEEFKLEVEEKE